MSSSGNPLSSALLNKGCVNFRAQIGFYFRSTGSYHHEELPTLDLSLSLPLPGIGLFGGAPPVSGDCARRKKKGDECVTSSDDRVMTSMG